MITENEKNLILNIAENEYQSANGAELFDESDSEWVWSDCLECGPCTINLKSIPGIMSSLVKKNLAYSEGEGRDSCVKLSPSGFSIYREIKEKKI